MNTSTFTWLFHQSKLQLRPLHSPHQSFTTVQASELKNPTEFTKEGAVVLTLGLAFEHSPADFSTYARTLASAGVHGIGFGTGLVFSKVPPELERACVDHGLTLFEVPRAIPFISIINAVNAEFTRQDQEQRRVFERQQERLNRAATRGVSALIAHAGKELRAAVALTDTQGVEITSVKHQGLDALKAAQDSSFSASNSPSTAHSVNSKNSVNVSTVTSYFQSNSQHHYGLTVCATEKIGPFDRALIRHVVGLAGLLLQSPWSTAQQRLGQLALAVQLELSVPMSLESAFSILSTSQNVTAYLVCTDTSTQLRRVLASLKPTPAQEGANYFRLIVDDSAALIVTAPIDDVSQEKLFSKHNSSIVRVSILPQIPWRELNPELITQMIKHAHSLDRGTSSIYSSPAPDWLHNPYVREALENRRSTTIDVLTDYDSEHGTQLLPTLEAFLLAGSQIAATSEHLAVHRHTVRSRIRKIQALCGVELTDPVVRAELLLLVVSD